MINCHFFLQGTYLKEMLGKYFTYYELKETAIFIVHKSNDFH